MARKPFTPDEVRRIIERLEDPAVFHNMTDDWPARGWTARHLSLCLEKKPVRFRIGKRKAGKSPLYETQCEYVEATLSEFLAWTSQQDDPAVGAFHDYPLSDYWAYADYKYIAKLFQDEESMFEEVVWSDFGYPGRDGAASTLWVGTEGANTPCHLDTYGYNLVFQVEGRKRWHLFSPDDTSCLYPTRIPYEESSVFSQVNVLQPDLGRFPAFSRARAHVVTLQPGQVLFVPRHWWHYVESLDPVTVSINSWIELEVDDEARVGEALTRALVCALKTTPSQDNTSEDWLNPTEDGASSHDENMQYLSLALQACVRKRSAVQEEDSSPQQGKDGHRASKRDASGSVKTNSSTKDEDGRRKDSSFMPPFGLNLVPVPCVTHALNAPKDPTLKDTRWSTDHNPQSASVSDFDSRTAQESGHDGRGDLHKRPEASTSAVVSEGLSLHSEGSVPQVSLSTTDLLESLVHPDVIALVSRLLLDRQRQLSGS
ncbi:HSPB1-associated protein 1 homolog [Engraulis encrasicolus]|uniref:HSPB1-associated protein 1 homolog n=1 Tax=Engraulis encrasicolus TaxID=184585 RepID=UPI002FCF4D37